MSTLSSAVHATFQCWRYVPTSTVELSVDVVTGLVGLPILSALGPRAQGTSTAGPVWDGLNTCLASQTLDQLQRCPAWLATGTPVWRAKHLFRWSNTFTSCGGAPTGVGTGAT